MLDTPIILGGETDSLNTSSWYNLSQVVWWVIGIGHAGVWSCSTSCLVGRWDHEGIPLSCRDQGSLFLRRLIMIWSCSALVSCLTISPSDTCPAWLSSALESCWHSKFNIVTSWLLTLFTFIYLSPSPLFDIFLFLYPSGLRYAHLGLLSYYIAVLGPGIKSVNMG